MSIYANAFETERLAGIDDGLYSLSPVAMGKDRERRKQWIGVGAAAGAAAVALVIGIAALALASSANKAATSASSATSKGPQFVPTRRIAFGSCTAYDMRPQTVWAEGVIPSKPDAWIWLGDMVYLDTSPVSCTTSATAGLSYCNCSNTGWLAYRGQCQAGNVDYARTRWEHAIHNAEYRAFLDFMCPSSPPGGGGGGSGSSGSSGAAGAEPSRFPPTGTDPSVCPRPIFGVYDDHDWGWNNGNRRLPGKAAYKRMFLDAVGEPQASSRRGDDSGIQGAYTLNGGGPGRDIDVVLLDERWYRDPLPCSARRAWCEGLLSSQPDHAALGWCRDFLLDDGATGRGSCCTKDDDLAAWCALPGSRSSPLWAAACDPTSSAWASEPLVLGPDNTTLLAVDPALYDSAVRELWPRLLQAEASPVCEVLGAAQRQWLSRRLARSQAALTLVASGSVVLGSVGYNDPVLGYCSGDDWNCYQPAQLNLLHSLANASSGCVVVLTGDFHYGDIKVVAPGPGTAYADRLKTGKLQKHIYQLMSSGMSSSTAVHDGAPCAGSYREDLLGLRPLGRCSLMQQPNFGMVEVDWEKGVVHLTVRAASGGGIATGSDGKMQHVAFSLRTCAPVPV
ncbi:hypothetical protein HYH02_004958 [Chlamydomonas schloesseri]|uniref:PhoD-like phosphatase metallophosphatase domain-containing protein n=1 Tax=Chlamydomonas schloesseri TaxID=2026947 RepID=A0A836B816_9CHLO|nr:hypothetical protein HYH02_004958 [Chlamydomonas schloesseri]|eukprot:KAG2450456.1 hypothetical protein HYH02_004958 [Chlamydomonas schloesseri]